jgi:hypothetical protein
MIENVEINDGKSEFKVTIGKLYNEGDLIAKNMIIAWEGLKSTGFINEYHLGLGDNIGVDNKGSIQVGPSLYKFIGNLNLKLRQNRIKNIVND